MDPAGRPARLAGALRGDDRGRYAGRNLPEEARPPPSPSRGPWRQLS